MQGIIYVSLQLGGGTALEGGDDHHLLWGGKTLTCIHYRSRFHPLVP